MIYVVADILFLFLHPMLVSSDRNKAFKDAFKKMINETLQENSISEHANVNSSCIFSEIKHEQSSNKMQHANIANLITELKQNLQETFKVHSMRYNVLSSLSRLSELIKNDNGSRRDIKDKEYIYEIFNSYNVENKKNCVNKLKKMIGEIKEKVSSSRETAKKLKEEVHLHEIERKAAYEKFEKLFTRFNNIAS